jgi:hypothetical protein
VLGLWTSSECLWRRRKWGARTMAESVGFGPSDFFDVEAVLSQNSGHATLTLLLWFVVISSRLLHSFTAGLCACRSVPSKLINSKFIPSER